MDHMSTDTLPLKKKSNKREKLSRLELINNTNTFVHRHVGPNHAERGDMLSLMGFASLDELIDSPPKLSIHVLLAVYTRVNILHFEYSEMSFCSHLL